MTERTLADENTAEVSVTFDLLANARRRGVLYAVKRDGAATVGELAERIATWQDDGISSPSAEEVRTSLVHVHLPKLADANVVTYDADDDTVELADAETVDPYLLAADESDAIASELENRSELAN